MTSDTLESSIATSGLLCQTHPGFDGWMATRAVAPEVAAWACRALERSNRLALKQYNRGETDADGYTYDQDTWIVESRGLDVEGSCPERSFTSREEALDKLRELMERYPETE